MSAEQKSTKSNNDNVASPTETSVSSLTGTELAFKTVARAIDGYDDAALIARLQIVTNKPDSPIEGIPTYTKTLSEIEAVDFSRYFIVIAFHGSTFPGATLTERGIVIKKIIQNEENICVQASFQVKETTVVPGIITPFHIVKVNKENMIQFGKLTFVLLDQSEKEKATTTCEILP